MDPAPLDFGLERVLPLPEPALAHPVQEQLNTVSAPEDTPVGLRELVPVQLPQGPEIPVLDIFNEDFLPPFEAAQPFLKVEP